MIDLTWADWFLILFASYMLYKIFFGSSVNTTKSKSRRSSGCYDDFGGDEFGGDD